LRGGQGTNIHAVVDPAISRQRNSVERFFCRFKPIRCVAIRLDKLARNFLATVLLAYEVHDLEVAVRSAALEGRLPPAGPLILRGSPSGASAPRGSHLRNKRKCAYS